jgi:uncharacterized protein
MSVAARRNPQKSRRLYESRPVPARQDAACVAHVPAPPPKNVNSWPSSASDEPADDAARPVVLDSNVVFDLWLFADPALVRLRRAVETRQIVWWCSPALHAELLHVLEYGPPDVKAEVRANQQVTAAITRWASMSDDAPLAPRLRCTDPDDQAFINLALAHAPCWLLSRDKAVLKLARRAAESGVRIATPLRWLSATSVYRPQEADRASGA